MSEPDERETLPSGGTDATVKLGGSAPEQENATAVRAWQNQRYAEDWYSDALRQAATGTGHNARRREIIFAICFAESYLFEWTMIEVLDRNFERLRDYFPDGRTWPVKKKWKRIPKRLRDDGLIEEVPDTSDQHGHDWDRLIRYRNGLVHAQASRPSTPAMPEGLPHPTPTRADLNDLAPGWAINVVVERVVRLHEASGTKPPAWLRPAAGSQHGLR